MLLIAHPVPHAKDTCVLVLCVSVCEREREGGGGKGEGGGGWGEEGGGLGGGDLVWGGSGIREDVGMKRRGRDQYPRRLGTIGKAEDNSLQRCVRKRDQRGGSSRHFFHSLTPQ